MVELEEGGMFDEDTMPDWMKTMRGVAVTRPSLQQPPNPFPDPVMQGLPPPGIKA